MVVTGVAFGLASSFWVLFVFAVVGTLNPSAGDVSVFLPTEQALLPSTSSDRAAHRALRPLRTGRLQRRRLRLAGRRAARPRHRPRRRARTSRSARCSSSTPPPAWWCSCSTAACRPASSAATPASVALGPSRQIVYRLAATFSLDAFGGGFVVQSHPGAVAAGALRPLAGGHRGRSSSGPACSAAFSGLVAVRIARRIGLVRTMVYTHLPANVLLMATPFMPTLGWR